MPKIQKITGKRPLNDESIHTQGLVAVLASLHAEQDAAVLNS
jgi:hypothetical protein